MRRIQAAQGAGMPVVAVGAESSKAIRQCYQIGFTRLQGHFISLPLSFQSASQMLLEQPSGPEVDDELMPQSEVEGTTLEAALEPAQKPELVEHSPQPPHKPLQLFSFEELTETDQAGSEAA